MQSLVVVEPGDSETGISEILASISDAGLGIIDLATEESDLEDIFLALTKRS